MQSAAPRKRRDSSPAPCAVKRAAVVTESAAEPTVAVPVDFLKNLGTAVGAIMNGLMTLPCEDVAARGRHVADLAKVQSLINEQLGAKKRSFGTGSGNYVLLDAFSWLSRRDLDQLLLRTRSDETVPLSDGTSDAAQAFGLLLSACRWSCVEKLQTNDAVPLNSDVFNEIIVHAPFIRVIHFQMGHRTCAFDVLPELAIRMTNSFAALEKFSIDAGRTAVSVTNALVGNCFKKGTTIVICDTRCISEDALMEFSFGECDRAEQGGCRHKLELDLLTRTGTHQNVDSLTEYRIEQQDDINQRFQSARGLHWYVTLRQHVASYRDYTNTWSFRYNSP